MSGPGKSQSSFYEEEKDSTILGHITEEKIESPPQEEGEHYDEDILPYEDDSGPKEEDE